MERSQALNSGSRGGKGTGQQALDQSPLNRRSKIHRRSEPTTTTRNRLPKSDLDPVSCNGKLATNDRTHGKRSQAATKHRRDATLIDQYLPCQIKALRPNCFSSHTHLQRVAFGLLVDRLEGGRC